jgi:PEGA domain
MRTACLLLCAIFLVGAYPLDARAQPKASTTAQVGQLFDQAEAAYAKGDKQGAYEAFKAAWALQKSYDIAGNLGIVELKLGKYRDAAEHFAWSLENYPPTADEAKQKLTEKKLAEALKEVGRLHVQVSVNGASVTVNGHAAGTAPISGTLFVEPGPIVVEAKLAGYFDGRKQVEIAKGGEETVALSLVPAPPPRRSVVPGAVMAGVGGAALVTGIGLLVAGRSKASSASAVHDAILNAGHSCVTKAANYDARCTGLLDTTSRGDTLQEAGVGLMIGGGAAAVGSAIYFLVPQASSAATRSGALRLTPTVSPGVAGLSFSGTF